MKKYILIVFMSLATFIDCISQDVETNIKLQGSNLSIEISITNNTKLPIYIPLSDWVLTKRFPDLFDSYYLPFFNIISNNPTNMRFSSIADGELPDIKKEFIPILLKIEEEKTAKIIIEIDTMKLIKNWSEKFLEGDFDFRISVADYYVLTDLFDIMKLNLNDFAISDLIVNIPLIHDKYTGYISKKYISKTKLKGDYKRLIRLPFIYFIKIRGVLQR